jgi:hypothetical protein
MVSGEDMALEASCGKVIKLDIQHSLEAIPYKY